MTGTPLLHLGYPDMYVKLEGENPSGSIKDRFAEHIIACAQESGDLQEGMTIVETSSGNTALALARVAAEQGYHSEFFVPATIGKLDYTRLRHYGAKVHVVSPDDPFRPLDLIQDLCKGDGYFWPMQYFNPHAPLSYHGLAREIDEQLGNRGGISQLICAVGTGATIMGLSDALQTSNPSLRAIAVVAEQGHSVPGMRPAGASLNYNDHVDIYDPTRPSRTILITAQQAQEGRDALFSSRVTAGLVSGAAFYAACSLIEDVNPGKEGNTVVILGDGKIHI